MQCLPAAQGPVAGDIFHTAAIRDHTLLLQQVIKVGSIKLGEAILLGDVDLKRKEEIVKLNSKPFFHMLAHFADPNENTHLFT